MYPSIPKLFVVSRVLGSGNPEMLWSRMQPEYLLSIVSVLEALPDGVPALGLVAEPPQAASASPQPTTAHAAARSLRWLPFIEPVLRKRRLRTRNAVTLLQPGYCIVAERITAAIQAHLSLGTYGRNSRTWSDPWAVPVAAIG